MKKLLSHTIIFLLFFTIIFGVGGNVLVHATEHPPEDPPKGTCTYSTPNLGERPSVMNVKDKTRAECSELGRGLGRSVSWSPNDSSQRGEVIPTEGTSLFGFLNPLTWVQKAVSVVVGINLKIVSLITGLAGIILNFVVNHTIVDMAKNYGEMTVISSAWGTVRDVANMGFIFVLLYASIQLILGIGKDTRKLIVNMIIAALLINFSMFFTKVVIDSSNIIAITFYNATIPAGAVGDPLNRGLSNALMEPLGIQSLWKAGPIIGIPAIITIGVMGSIVSLIAAFVFFAIALMLIIRYVVLIFVIILSPIAVVSLVFPNMSGTFTKWKDALFNQAFFAPVYMFLTWITISIFQNVLGSGTKDMAAALGGTMKVGAGGQNELTYTAGSVGILFNFIVVIVFLIATLVISKNMSNKSGSVVSKMTGAAMGLAGGATLGMVGRLGRGVIGSRADAITKDENLKARAASGDMGARLKLATAHKLAKSSFDIRGTLLGGELGAGKARVGGYAKDQETREKTYAKYKPNAEKLKEEEEEASEKLERSAKPIREAAEKEFESSPEVVEARRKVEEATKIMGASLLDINQKEGKARREAELKTAQEKLAELERSHREATNKKIYEAHGKKVEEVAHAENTTRDAPGRMEAMAKKAEKPLFSIFGREVRVPGGKSRALAIRKAAKGESRQAQIARLSREDAEEKLKKEKESEPEKEKEPKETPPPPPPPRAAQTGDTRSSSEAT